MLGSPKSERSTNDVGRGQLSRRRGKEGRRKSVAIWQADAASFGSTGPNASMGHDDAVTSSKAASRNGCGCRVVAVFILCCRRSRACLV